MYFVTTYTFTGKRSKKKTTRLLNLFGERGSTPGTISHYVFADGGGGFLISDESGLARLYDDALHYGPWMDLSTRPIHALEDSLPISAAWSSS